MIKIFGKEIIDEKAIKQLENCMTEDSIGVLTADAHYGYAHPIGGAIAYKNHISMSGVGFDIGCGNAAVQTNIKYQDINIKKIMDQIFSDISFGMGRNSKNKKLNHEIFDKIEKADCIYQRSLIEVAMLQLGTVGGGNHYVDIFKDENDFIWIGVHFGSRGFGHKTTSGFIALSQNKDFWDKAQEGSMDAKPILFDMSTDLGQTYFEAMKLAGEYAYAGRELVIRQVLGILDNPKITFHVHNHHNFAWKENHFGEDYYVVRKGCTPAFPAQQGFIGANMKDTSVIVEGVDSEISKNGLYSTVHGAGRVLSRRAAKGRTKWKKLNGSRREVRLTEGLVDFKNTKKVMKEMNIELRGADSDESFECYKNLEEVLNYQGNTIKILHKLFPIGVAMAGEGVVDLYKD